MKCQKTSHFQKIFRVAKGMDEEARKIAKETNSSKSWQLANKFQIINLKSYFVNH